MDAKKPTKTKFTTVSCHLCFKNFLKQYTSKEELEDGVHTCPDCLDKNMDHLFE